jgi:membrane protein implicated in regulation of membrane protease activity
VVHGGSEELIGAHGSVRVALDPLGQVFVHGSLWRARHVDRDQKLERGELIVVEGMDGLTLEVRPEAAASETKETSP